MHRGVSGRAPARDHQPLALFMTRLTWDNGATRGAIAITLAAVLYNNLVNLLPQNVHDVLYVPLNLVVGAVFGLVAWRWLRLGRAGLGLDRHVLLPGLRWGTGAGLAIVAPLYVALLVPAAQGLLDDARVQELSLPALAYVATVRIPLGTALFEEWVFRGVLHAAWLRAAGSRMAWAVPSAAFGLWHVAPSLEALAANRPDASAGLVFLFVAGSVLATALGGVLFAALRTRTGGIVAPVVAHGLVNSLALVASYLAA